MHHLVHLQAKSPVHHMGGGEIKQEDKDRITTASIRVFQNKRKSQGRQNW